jgi:hypothetical protein
MSRIDSLTQMRVKLTHATTQLSPASPERIQQAWAGVPMNDTHKATAFKEAAEKLHAHHELFDDETIIGTPQRIKLPFKCEEVIVDWEVQAFENDREELTDGLGGTQFCFVLSIDLASVTKARKKKPKGGSCARGQWWWC